MMETFKLCPLSFWKLWNNPYSYIRDSLVRCPLTDLFPPARHWPYDITRWLAMTAHSSTCSRQQRCSACDFQPWCNQTDYYVFGRSALIHPMNIPVSEVWWLLLAGKSPNNTQVHCMLPHWVSITLQSSPTFVCPALRNRRHQKPSCSYLSCDIKLVVFNHLFVNLLNFLVIVEISQFLWLQKCHVSTSGYRLHKPTFL